MILVLCVSDKQSDLPQALTKSVEEMQSAGVHPAAELLQKFGPGHGGASVISKIFKDWGLADKSDGQPLIAASGVASMPLERFVLTRQHLEGQGAPCSELVHLSAVACCVSAVQEKERLQICPDLASG